MAANTISHTPTPSSEKARLASLMSYGVLDTDPAPEFDELTALAADIFGTPIALVSVIDSHRQWFKSRHGMTTTETSRDLAFCAHTILGADLLLVTDPRTDARFANNPMVLGDPHIGFYAGMPLINDDGHALGTLCVIDHVQRTATAQQLLSLQRIGRQVVRLLEQHKARNEAVRRNIANSAFLETMSHELRTPLNGVLGLTNMLQDTTLGREQRELCDMVKACGAQLVAVMDDALDFSNLECGSLTVSAEPFDLRDLVAGVVNTVRSSMGLDRFSIDPEFELGRHSRRYGDPARVRQMILNMIEFALTLSTNGRFLLRVESRDRNPNVQVNLSNTGIKLAASQAEATLDQLARPRAGALRRYGGTALGLSLTRRIIDAMGGEMGIATGTPGPSRFWFRLPLPIAPAIHANAPAGPAMANLTDVRGMRVLVAEDNPVNQMVVMKVLELLGCAATVVGTGAATIAAWRDAPYDAILMDCHMPDGDGFDTTRQIRDSGEAGSAIPIIALTATAVEANRERCLDAGMTDFLCKPLSVMALREALSRASR